MKEESWETAAENRIEELESEVERLENELALSRLAVRHDTTLDRIKTRLRGWGDGPGSGASGETVDEILGWIHEALQGKEQEDLDLEVDPVSDLVGQLIALASVRASKKVAGGARGVSVVEKRGDVSVEVKVTGDAPPGGLVEVEVRTVLEPDS